jgi:hypothetical protein
MVLDAGGERNYSGLPGTFEHLAAADGFLAAHRRLAPGDPPQTSPRSSPAATRPRWPPSTRSPGASPRRRAR